LTYKRTKTSTWWTIITKTSSKEVWEKIGKLFVKRKTARIKSITKIDGKSTTSAREIANEFADQFARMSYNENYTKGFRMKKIGGSKIKHRHRHWIQRILQPTTHRGGA
jgi:transcription elongation factor GreA-like protein